MCTFWGGISFRWVNFNHGTGGWFPGEEVGVMLLEEAAKIFFLSMIFDAPVRCVFDGLAFGGSHVYRLQCFLSHYNRDETIGNGLC